MGEGIDINEVTAKFAAALASDVYDKSVKKITRSLSMAPGVIDQSLRSYSKTYAESLSSVRTIISDRPSDLLSIYQPLYFELDEKIVSESQLQAIIATTKQISIKGHAGAGKSMFLRRHFIRRLNDRACIPLFVELRSFSHSPAANFFGFLFENARSKLPWLEIESFRAMLKRGQIELLLDALDEVVHGRRGALNSELTALINQYPDARVIITTRYGDRYSALPTAQEYHVRPFSKEQSVSLVRSLDFDPDSKERFAIALDRGLYDKTPDLLSNPLLCSIMLLTYRRFAHIPDRLHLYYQQAYEVLFSRHDASKEGGLKREFLSDLDVAQMQKVLDHFSAISYASEHFEFSEFDCLELLREAIEATAMGVKPSDVKDDLVEAVSMLNRDGLELRFTHRSFQEFFCAHYIANSRNELAAACIDAVKRRIDTDSVIDMAYALNAEKFDEAWMRKSLKDDIERWKLLSEVGRFSELFRDSRFEAKFTGGELRVTIGSVGDRHNDPLYVKYGGVPAAKIKRELVFSAQDIFRADRALKVSDEEEQKGAASKKKGKPSDVQFPSASFASLAHVYPEHFTAWKAGVIPKAAELSLDWEAANFQPLSKMGIWKRCSDHVIGMLEAWHDRLERRVEKGSSAALRAFQAAAGERIKQPSAIGGGRRDQSRS